MIVTTSRMKILVHEGLGVWLAARRVNQGRFVWPRTGQIRIELTDEQLQALGAAGDIPDLQAVFSHEI